MNKEPQGTLEVSKDVVFQLKSMAQNSAGLEADGSPDDERTTPPVKPVVPDPDPPSTPE